jgi:hypothetical protein
MQELVTGVKEQNRLLKLQLASQTSILSLLRWTVILVLVGLGFGTFSVWRGERTRATLDQVMDAQSAEEQSSRVLKAQMRGTALQVADLQAKMVATKDAVTRVAEDVPKVSMDEKGKLQVQVAVDAKTVKRLPRRQAAAVTSTPAASSSAGVAEEPRTRATLPVSPTVLEQ